MVDFFFSLFFCFGSLYAQENGSTIQSDSIPVFKQLYIAFAGPYPASPSSALGHIFLVIEPDTLSKTPYLLWKAINFGADIESINQIELFWYGLFGGLKGKFSELYFHEKIQEYSNIESRPIWLIPVNLSYQEKRRFQIELENRKNETYNYRFTNLNCVNYIEDLVLASIDSNTAMPTRFYTTPEDFIISSPILQSRISKPILLKSIEQILSENSIHKSQNLSFQLLFLEKKLQLENKMPSKKQQSVLEELRVSVMNQKNESIQKVVFQDQKLYLHPLQFFESFAGISDKQSELRLNYRFAAHDFHDKDDAFSRVELIEVAKLSLGFSAKQKPIVHSYSIFNQMSLQASTALSNYYAWSLSIGGKRRIDLENSPFSHEFIIGTGKSFYWFDNKNYTSAFLVSFAPSYIHFNGFNFDLKLEYIQLVHFKAITWLQKVEQYVDIFHQKFRFNPVYSSEISFRMANSFRLMQKASISVNGYDLSIGIRKSF